MRNPPKLLSLCMDSALAYIHCFSDLSCLPDHILIDLLLFCWLHYSETSDIFNMEVSSVEMNTPEHFPDQNMNSGDEPDQRRFTFRGKLFVTCVVISSVPIIIPSLLTLSALGITLSIPVGLFLAGYSFTDKLICKLLPSSEPWFPEESFTDDSHMNDTARDKYEGRRELSTATIQCQNELEEATGLNCMRKGKMENFFSEEGAPSAAKGECFSSLSKNNTTEVIGQTSPKDRQSSSGLHPNAETQSNAGRKGVEEKLRLVEAVLGCRGGLELTTSQRVDALVSMVGVKVSSRSDVCTVSEVEEKLQLLMAVVGVE